MRSFIGWCSSTVTNWSMYFNKSTANIILHISVMRIRQKNGTHLNVRIWFRVCNLRQNRSFHVAIGVNRTLIHKFMTPGCKLLDSRIQAGFPKKNILEGERGVWNTWMPQVGGGPYQHPIPWGQLVHGSRKTKWATHWVMSEEIFFCVCRKQNHCANT